MNEPSQPLIDALRTGWRWWKGELASLVPGAGTRARSRSRIIVSSDQGGLRLIDERNRRSKPVEVLGDEAWRILGGLGRSRPPASVQARVPYSACFLRRVDVPEAVRDEVANFLELDLERATPFRLKDVYSSHYVHEGQSGSGMIGVSHVIARREIIDRLVQDIQNTGVRVSGVDCWNAEGTASLPVDFLEHGKPHGQMRPAKSRVVGWLAAASVVLAVSAAYIARDKHETALAELVQKTDAARAKSQEISQALTASDQRLREMDAVARYRLPGTARVEVLEHLTKLLPDTAWVSDLRINDGTVELTGEAESAAPLIAAMESSPYFADAAFTAPVTRDASGKERFSLRMRLKMARVEPSEASEGALP